ncbi:MAG: hypothetical protein J7L34_03470 [Thermotogaceae bacterium]|nr:hypothetical protein [Thermotogaceae bacterium]
MKKPLYSALISASIITGVLSLFFHGYIALSLSVIASTLALIMLGRSKAIIGLFILVLIVGSYIGVDYVIENLPVFPNFSNFYGERPYEARKLKHYLKDFKLLEKSQQFPDVEELEVLGKNIEISFSSSGDMVVDEGMYFRRIGKKLEVYSKKGGRVRLSNIKHLEIDGYNMSVTGKGVIERLEINGMNNNISFEDDSYLDFELNGFSNSVNLTLNHLGNFEINGASNLVKLRFKSTKSGRVRVEISGTGNNTEVILEKNSDIRIVKEVNPSFMNDLQVITNDND